MIRHYLLLFFVALTTLSFGQKRDLSLHTPWFISLNAGGTWHSTDVKTRVNGGGGLTLGYSLLKTNNSPVWLDIYGRFLVGKWKGNDLTTSDLSNYEGVLSSGYTDYKNTYGKTLHNFKNNAVEFNLEAALHFKRIVQRTGWDPYILGGFGLGFNRAWGNYRDGEYMYLFSDSYSDNFSVDAQLDNSYETYLDKNQTINGMLTGHLGVGLGYYFTNGFSMGIEHKTTFTGNDYFDGLLTNNVRKQNDIYHYTSLYLKWYFGRGRWTQTTNPPVVTNPPVITNPPVTPPVVVPCYTPTINVQSATGTVSNPNYTLVAYLQNAIAGQTQVTINGALVPNVNFQTNGRLTSQLGLYEGINTIQITTWNECGQDTETIRIQYQPQCDDPLVTFTNPRTSRVSTESAAYNYSAQLNNIQRGNLVQVYVNGTQQSNFTINYSTLQLSGTANLHQGTNTIQIIATNNCGSHTQTVNVEYNVYCPIPIIQLTSNRGEVQSARYYFTANISDISQTNQVVVKLNGIQQNGISVTRTATGVSLSSYLTLAEGINRITITATNSCGNDTETFQVIYDEPCVPATILVTAPRTSKLTTSESTIFIQATITDVDEKSDIRFMVNGVYVNDFTYNATTDILKATVRLNEGQNTIQITAQNDCSTVTENIGVTYTRPCNPPTVNFTAPSNGSTVTTTSTTVYAAVNNVTSVNQLEVYLNGTRINNFTFTNGVVTIPINMINGNNTVQIIATTVCGSQSNKLNVISNPPKPTVPKPQVTFKSDCDIVVEPGSRTFSGQVSGVTSPDQITVLVNGQEQNNIQYSFNGSTYNFNVQVRAGTVGQYTVTIIATNEGGTTTKTCTVTVKDDPIIEICYIGRTITIKESEWPTYSARGATKGKCRVTEVKEDTTKIDICLNGVNMVIYRTQWKTYSAKGAIQGKCPEAPVDNDLIICIKENGKPVTRTIKESQWEAFKEKGATLGACPEIVDNDIEICFNNKTIVIKESVWSQYQRLGATLGKCPTVDPEITICHRVGNTLTTLKIKQSEWPTYQAQGATLGECPVVVDQEIVICMKSGNTRTTRTIKQSQWATYQRLGATLGACPDSTVTGDNDGNVDTGTITNGMLICVYENGEYVTKTINPLQWNTYQQKGAIRGACTGNEVPPQNIQAPRSNTTTPTTRPVLTKPTQTNQNRTTTPKTPTTTTPKGTTSPSGGIKQGARQPVDSTPASTTRTTTSPTRTTTTPSSISNTRRP